MQCFFEKSNGISFQIPLHSVAELPNFDQKLVSVIAESVSSMGVIYWSGQPKIGWFCAVNSKKATTF